MGIYTAYSYFRSVGNIIGQSPLWAEGVVNVHHGTYRIILGDHLSTEEKKVKTLLHELLHLSPENRGDLRIGLNRKYNPELEDRIEKEVEEIYSCQPLLVAHLRKRVESLPFIDRFSL